MDAKAFWELVDRVHAAAPDDMGTKCECLQTELQKLGDDDLRDFRSHFDEVDARAYDWKLWAAAYVLNGGCSDDSFSDFRASLISRGRAAFEAALNDPDSLADLEPSSELFFEGYQYVANEVAETRWGTVPARAKPFPTRPSGEDWKEEDLPSLLPRLAGGADAPSPVLDATAAPNVAPASFTEWKAIPIPMSRKVDLLIFGMIWRLPDATERFTLMRSQMEAHLNDPDFQRGMRQPLRELGSQLEGHERLIDGALRTKGLITFTEYQAHAGKTVEGIIQAKAAANFFQYDLAQRVLECGIPLSAAERTILTKAVATYKPEPSKPFESLDDGE